MKRLVIAAVLSLICIPLRATPQNQPTLETAGRIVRLLEDTGYKYEKLSPAVWTVTFKGDEMPTVLVFVMPLSSSSRVAEEILVESVIALHDNVANPVEVMRTILKSNNTAGDASFALDEDGDYVVRGRYNLAAMNGASLKKSLEAIAGTADDGYGAIKTFLGSGGSTGTSTYRTSPSATERVSFLNGKAVINFNPMKWKQETSKETGRFSFQHVSGDGYAMIISERIQIPMDGLKDIALGNAREVAPDMKIVEEQHRRVNGTDILLLRMEGTIKGIPFTYFGYYYGGQAGTVQLITYTGQNLFQEYRKDFEEFLNGFTVQP